MQLRPLGLGEIFNRAAGLYFRNFRSFVTLVAIAVLPMALVQYFVTLSAQPEIDATLRSLMQPPGHAQHAPTLLNSPANLAAIVASVALSYLLLAIAVSAVGVAVARIYRGEPVLVRASYEVVLARLPAIIQVLGAALAALVLCYVALLFVAVIPLTIGALLARVLPALSAIATAALLVAMTVCLALLLLAGACGFFSVVVENQNAGDALWLTLCRIFNRNEFGRALICAIAVGGIGLAGSLVAAAFFGFSQIMAADVAIDAVARTLFISFLAIVLAVYYFDVRLRLEGLDLEAEPNEPVYAPTAYLTGEERAAIKRFLERRDVLAPHRRREIAAKLAGPVRQRVPEELRRLEDEPLLERL